MRLWVRLRDFVDAGRVVRVKWWTGWAVGLYMGVGYFLLLLLARALHLPHPGKTLGDIANQSISFGLGWLFLAWFVFWMKRREARMDAASGELLNGSERRPTGLE